MITNDHKDSIFGGGTAILIKKNLNYEILNLNANEGNKIIETTAITLKNNNINKLHIISMYATNNNKAEMINELNNILDEIKQNNRDIFTVLAGDFNAGHPE